MIIYLGDIRVLKAIDVPHLHHLHDCIVFPCNGKNKNKIFKIFIL